MDEIVKRRCRWEVFFFKLFIICTKTSIHVLYSQGTSQASSTAVFVRARIYHLLFSVYFLTILKTIYMPATAQEYLLTILMKMLYLKSLVLLYADDTVIFGIDPHSYQENLNSFYKYCELWKLHINYNKTKIIIFGMCDPSNLQLGDRIFLFAVNSNTLG